MTEYFTIKKKDGELLYTESKKLSSSQIKDLSSPIRFQILECLSKKPQYPIELAKNLKIHEQTIYYHIKQLQKGEFIEVADKKEIRGTTAKSYRPSAKSFVWFLEQEWKEIGDLLKDRKSVFDEFLAPFLKGAFLNSSIVVGSPDPHGPLKARARDGHLASDLALFLGNHCKLPKDFTTKLDVEIKDNELPMIILGGPVTNIITSSINSTLPIRFSDEKPFGLVSSMTHRKYSDEHVGLIIKTQNPFNQHQPLLLIAGITAEGTKAAVIGLTRFTRLVLQNYTGQKSWCRVVQGFDMDADGKIDSVEILE